MTLEDLFRELDRFAPPVPLGSLTAGLRELVVDPRELEGCIRFGASRYQRNLLAARPGYHALVLCWRPGQCSPIHDHRGSACGVRVLRGRMTETTFDRSGEDGLLERETLRHGTGEVTGSFDLDIHQVSNQGGDPGGLVTLHIYSPPLLTMGRYERSSGRRVRYVDPVVGFLHGDGI